MLNLALGAAFAGPLYTPSPWPSLTQATALQARSAGCNWCSIPVWYGAPIEQLVQLVKLAMMGGLYVIVVPHCDGLGSDADSLMPFLGFGQYRAWFAALCAALRGLPVAIELWNEAEYTADQAERYGLGWPSMSALYVSASQLVSLARNAGLHVICPLPLDQSPEQTAQLIQAGAFPISEIGSLGVDGVSAHIYEVPGSEHIGRIRTVSDVAADLGVQLLVTETNAGVDAWRITAWEKTYRMLALPRIYWQWVSAPPAPSDFSAPAVLAAIKQAATA